MIEIIIKIGKIVFKLYDHMAIKTIFAIYYKSTYVVNYTANGAVNDIEAYTECREKCTSSHDMICI